MGTCNCVSGEKRSEEKDLIAEGDVVEKNFRFRGYLSSLPSNTSDIRETTLSTTVPDSYQVSYLQSAWLSYLSRKEITRKTQDWVVLQGSGEPDEELGVEFAGNPKELLSKETVEVMGKMQGLRMEKRVRDGVSYGPMQLVDGSVYLGEWKLLGTGMCRHGRGRLYCKDGGYCEGYWLEGKLHLVGRQIYPTGEYYEGGFNEGFRSGRGTYISPNSSYSGSWYLNEKHGYGEERLPSQVTYEGAYEHGSKTGMGTFTWGDGSRYTGELVKGQMEGSGEYWWPDGRHYKGQWKAGKMHGEGEFTYAPTRVYKGHYENDHKEGFGVYSWDGKVYEGQWLDNKMHGAGYLTIDGVRRKCEFREGRKVRDLE